MGTNHKLQEDNPNLQNKYGTRMWYNCALGFYWEGVEEILDTDIVFEPGYYMWNEHVLRNWKTMAPEFDFIYLIQATGERLKKDGTPRIPHLYRYCPNGVVVRKLRKEHECGGSRPSYENRGGYVHIINVPEAVTISGEEFRFITTGKEKDALKKWIAKWKQEALKVVI